jgi:NADPH:quinone reductase-like Zn-dependent oxidoreductase
VLLGFLAGARGELDLGPLLGKRLEVIGTMMRTRGHEERAALAAEFAEHVVPLFTSCDGAAPVLRPVVGTKLKMRDLADAHRAMERNETFGKVVLVW